MNPCILIPCFDHPATVGPIAAAAQKLCRVIVVDDGSTPPLPELPGCEQVRLARNSGKAAALRAGFGRAIEMGFTHAITMDADGQHFADDLPKFLEAARVNPSALAVGVRDLRAAGAPGHRRRSNAVSSFWFRVETGIRLRDTQCGFRCYPLALTTEVVAKSEFYAFELEFMVRAAWVGAPVVPVAVKCTYDPGKVGKSHFRPVVDLWRITIMNIGLVLQSWFVPRALRVVWSRGQKYPFRRTIREFFTEHAHEPVRLAGAVGLGLFCGIAPIWGFQIITGLALAHWLGLNKAITVTSSHVSLPPFVPAILFLGLQTGHRLFQGHWLALSVHDVTWPLVTQYFFELFLGSVLLAAVAGVAGFFLTWFAASLWRKG